MQRENEQRAGPDKKLRLTKQQKILTVIAVILAVAVAGVAACKSLIVKPELPEETKEEEPGGEEVPEEEPIDYGEGIRPKAEGARKSEDLYTILILGRDTGGGGNTDTMLLASYDVTNQKATVMSIPRDTMVNVPWDVKKINSVYNWYGGGEKGIKAVYKEIAQLVGFEPDYEVVVEWDAVGKIVDAIGGVYFDVPYDMNYHDPEQNLSIEQAKGYRLLTGEDAMEVIRWRQNDNGFKVGDDGRIRIQQDFLKAVIEQLVTPSNLLNISKIAEVFQESVETDLSFQNILWFGQQAILGGLKVENVDFLTMPFQFAGAFTRVYSKQLGRAHYLSYVVPVPEKLLAVVNDQLSPYADPFSLSDLDIMYVNADGSVSSTGGYVEDEPAALPPDLSPYQTKEPEQTEEETETPEDTEPSDTSVETEAPPEEVLPEETGESTPADENGGEPAEIPAETAETNDAEEPSNQSALPEVPDEPTIPFE